MTTKNLTTRLLKISLLTLSCLMTPWALAKIAAAEEEAQRPDPFYKAKLQTARFYFARLLPETLSLMNTARSGADVLMDTDLALS